MMRKILLSSLIVLMLQACGGQGGGNIPARPGPVNMDDLTRYIVTAESDKAIVVNSSSPFGTQAIKRTVIASVDDLQRVGQVDKNARLAIRFSKSATPAQMRQFAQYGKTALRNPRNAAILGALLATGVVVGYELLEDENAPTVPQPSPGVTYADLSSLASREDILKGLKAFQLPKQTLDAVSAELALPSQKDQNTIVQSLALSSEKTKTNPSFSTKAFLLPASSTEASIEEVKFSRSIRSGKLHLNISVKGQITNQTRTIVKARFFDPGGNPLLNSGSGYTNATGQVEVNQELIGVISRNKFHDFSSQKPLILSLPMTAFSTFGAHQSFRCRVEVYHKHSGKLLAASALLPIL